MLAGVSRNPAEAEVNEEPRVLDSKYHVDSFTSQAVGDDAQAVIVKQHLEKLPSVCLTCLDASQSSVQHLSVRPWQST